MDHVVHFELSYENGDRARAFYANVFGWQIQRSPIPGMEYDLAMTVATDAKHMPVESGAINGGLMPRMPGGEHTTIVVKVNALDAALARIKEAGGAVVMEPIVIGDMGRYARIRDTEGNVVGVWQDLPKS